MTEWRMVSLGYFQSLGALCKLAHSIVSNDLKAFHARTIVTNRLLNEHLLRSSFNNTLEEFLNSMQIEFEHVNNVLRLLFEVNQYYSGSSYNGQLHIYNEADRGTIKVEKYISNYFLKLFLFKIKFDFGRPVNTLTESPCLCAIQNDCKEPVQIFHSTKSISVPGFVRRCSAMDSILSSTLECFYSNTDCLRKILFRYINYTNTVVPVPPLNVSQLIRSYSNSTVASLADNLFVEDWKISLSHMKYFSTCAPSSCQHTFIKRANHLYVVTMLLAVYGGLTLALNLLVPSMVKFVLRCRQPTVSVNKRHRSKLLINYLYKYKYDLIYI